MTVISGGGGERLDHHLAELVLLGAARFAPLHLDARIGTARAVAIHGGDDVSLTGAPGAVLTLLALGGPATGLTTTGVLWPLSDDTLEPGSTRGVSNEIVASPVRVALESGSLLVVGTQPLERDEGASVAERLSRAGRRRRSPSGPGCSRCGRRRRCAAR